MVNLKSIPVWFWLLMLLQLVDVLVHTLSGQLEVIRVVSNAVILLGSYFWVSQKTKRRDVSPLTLGVGGYLALNFIFLLINGFTNDISGNLRFPLFLFVILSTISGYLLIRKRT